jgi:hypothetical protein
VHNPHAYSNYLEAAHPAIAAFGGIFLMMIFLDWLLTTEARDHSWFKHAEQAGSWLAGKLDILSSALALGVLYLAAQLSDHTLQVLGAGVLGWLVYWLVQALDKLTEAQAARESADEADAKRGGTIKLAAGGAGFVLFLKLELIDASFSFDGVSAAFAITSNIIAIALGLGIGSLFVRSLTIYLTRENKMEELVYLEHGAYWSIGFLAAVLFATMQHPLPEWLTGGVGVAIIAGAYLSSVLYRRRHPAEFVIADETVGLAEVADVIVLTKAPTHVA